MSELKPCPFCGGNAELGGDDAHEYAVVYCEKCGNSTDGYLVDECGYHHASEAWNRRTPEEALTEINRLQSEENKQLQQDKAKLVELVESSYIEGCHDGYREGLSDGQDWSSSKNNLEPDESWDISESKTKLEKHKCD